MPAICRTEVTIESACASIQPRNRQIGNSSALELLNQPGCVFVAALAAKTDALKLAGSG